MAKYQRGVVQAIKHQKSSYKVGRGVTSTIKKQTYQTGRGVTQKIQASTKGTVAVNTRTVTAAIQNSRRGTTKMGARGMTVAARVTAVSVKKFTRRIVETKTNYDTPREKPTKAEVNYADPWGNFNFALYWGDSDKPIAHFMECSGLKTSAEVFEIKEGGLNGRTHKRVGQSKWENITLRYASSADNQLVDWRSQYIQDKFMTDGLRTDPKKSTGAIVLHDASGAPIRRYEFKDAWPVSWEGPSLSSGGSDLALETLEIAHGGLTIKEPS